MENDLHFLQPAATPSTLNQDTNEFSERNAPADGRKEGRMEGKDNETSALLLICRRQRRRDVGAVEKETTYYRSSRSRRRGRRRY